MSILTNDDIDHIRWSTPVQNMATDSDLVMLTKGEMTTFAKSIESAVIAKLNKEKPVCYVVIESSEYINFTAE